MRRLAALWRGAAAMLALAAGAACLPALAAAPEVRVQVMAQQPVAVGQQVEIQVTVAAPNFFTSAPPFPSMTVDGAIITMPDERGTHSVEHQGGQTVATIRKSYVFVARRAGEFMLPQVPIEFTYSGDGGAPQQGHLELPPTRITARLPEGAREGDAVLPAAALRISQQLDRDAAQLSAGDALVRTVQVEADNTQAMLIPPPEFDAPEGVRVFTADPVLDELNGRDGGFAGGRRTDKATYVFERPGRYVLPAIELRWFDPVTRKPAHAEAPAVAVQVRAAAQGGEAIPPDLPAAAQAPRHRVGWWTLLAWGAGLALLAALAAWAWRRRARWRARRQARQLARTRSDEQMFKQVLHACRRGDAAAAHAALLAWSRRHAHAAPRAWAQRQGDAALDGQIEALEGHLFGAARAQPWTGGGALASALEAAHQRWGRERAARAVSGWRRFNAHGLQTRLNPLTGNR